MSLCLSMCQSVCLCMSVCLFVYVCLFVCVCLFLDVEWHNSTHIFTSRLSQSFRL